MARIVPDRDPETGKFLPSEAKANPANPTLFGEDMANLAWMAIGAGLAGTGNDKITAPIVSKFAPTLFAGGAVGKLADATTTAVTGWGLGEFVGLVSRPVGHRMKTGAMVLAIAKALGVVLPINLSAAVNVPAGFQLFSQPSVPAVTNGKNGTAALPAASPPADKYFNTYPSPVAADQAVGL